MSKRVCIAIEADEHFLRMLIATLSLKRGAGPRRDGPQRTALAHLGALVLAEFRGALVEQIQEIEADPDWYGHVRILPEARVVTEEPDAP